jgi:hypothetical protein
MKSIKIKIEQLSTKKVGVYEVQSLTKAQIKKGEKPKKLKVDEVVTEEMFSFESKEVEVSKLTNEQIALTFGGNIFNTIQHFKTSKTKMFVNGYEFKPSQKFYLYLNVDGNDYNLDEFTNFFSFDKQVLKLGSVGIKNDKISLGRYDILVMAILKILKGIDGKSLLISNKDVETIKLSIANNVKLLA